jgi:hypothetical protein
MGSGGEPRILDCETFQQAEVPSLGLVWHAPGRFTETVCKYLVGPVEVMLQSAGKRYVDLEAVELGGGPSVEEVNLRFRLSADVKKNVTPRWGRQEACAENTLPGPVFYYTFSSEVSLEENVEDFRAFIAQSLGDELGPTPAEPAKSSGIVPMPIPRRDEMDPTPAEPAAIPYATITNVSFILVMIVLGISAGLAAHFQRFEWVAEILSGLLVVLGIRVSLPVWPQLAKNGKFPGKSRRVS